MARCARGAVHRLNGGLSHRFHTTVSMARAMIVGADRSLRRARTTSCAVVACAVAALAAMSPAGAPAAGTTSQPNKILGIPIPASARVHGATTTPAAAAPATTTPAATTHATTTPASGAQPGTVAPTTTTPASAVPPPTTTPASTTPTVAVPPTATPTSPPASGSTTVVGVARKASPSNTRLSTGALALAVLGALLALGCIVWVLGRWLALEPRWTISLMHSLREAGYRGSATWAEFTDWARLGR
jgi:cobalamin biosynthesis Mg chelatase CobN